MTPGQEYYLEQFKKIDEGKFSWNWAAFFTLGFWVYYRKTYIGMIITNIAGFFLLYIPEITLGKLSPNAVSIGTAIYLFICGAFGNRWYYDTVKRKIKEGYHLDNEYKNVSGWAVTIFIVLGVTSSILVGIVTSVLGYSEYIVNHIDFWAGIIVYSIAIYVMCLIEKRKMAIKTKKNNSFEINEENILKII